MAVKNLSKTNYTIKAQSVQTISFMGERPNFYKITNGGTTPLYVGTSMMPTEDFFDMKIPPSMSKLCVDGHAHHEIYIYNPSLTDTNIIITSFTDDFNPVVMALSDIGQDFSSVEFTGEVDATGNLKTLLNTIKTNTNDTATSINNVSMDISNIKNILRDSLENKMCAVYVKEMTVSASSLFTSYCDDNRIVSSIDILSNDGENDIILGICNILDNPDEYWTTITVKSGEVISNISCYASAIKMTCNSSNGSAVRLVFREEAK